MKYLVSVGLAVPYALSWYVSTGSDMKSVAIATLGFLCGALLTNYLGIGERK